MADGQLSWVPSKLHGVQMPTEQCDVDSRLHMPQGGSIRESQSLPFKLATPSLAASALATLRWAHRRDSAVNVIDTVHVRAAQHCYHPQVLRNRVHHR